ncbi:hypothetical protein K457DRAFT_660690 [Linnemannia elongata AG-77]|uniref:Uncharacterized protein n=1 Tax=Linnemannia elongata AG-77 TaxID=1314771 RepID=A0A197JRY7_9FUNG|nr:hypothetical protein K457DRAFT_660690 [Linnemannia elongata AG-77]
MNSLTQDQRSKTQTLISIINIKEQPAIALLRDAKWDIQVAVNNYYNGATAAPQTNTKQSEPVNSKQIEKIFEDFKGMLPFCFLPCCIAQRTNRHREHQRRKKTFGRQTEMASYCSRTGVKMERRYQQAT